MNNSHSAPLVSVILPSYNHALFIEECIQSVLNQTYKNLEIIVIDDGSSDNTVNIITDLIKKVQDPRLKFISQQNAGPSNTINRAISMSTGPLVTILNTDDVFYPPRIQELVNAWEATKSEFIFTKVRHIDSDGNSLPSAHSYKRWYDKSLMNLLLEPSVGFALLKANSAVTTGNFFFTRKLYDELKGFSSNRVAHDLDFILRASLVTEPHFVNAELMGYRVHGNNDIIRSAHLIKPEIEQIIQSFFLQQFTEDARNPLAPTQKNWPLYFSNFVKHNHLERIYHRTFRPLLEKGVTAHAELGESQKTPQMHDGKKQEIHLVSHELSLTGAPALIYELAMQLRQQNFQPTVHAPRGGPLKEVIEKQGLPVKIVRYGDWTAKRTYFRKAAALFLCTRDCTKKISGQVVLNSIANWPLLIALYFNPKVKKIFFYIHEDFSPDSFIEKRLARKLVKYILNSPKVEMWFGSKYTQNLWQDLGYKGRLQYFSGFNQLANSAQQNPISPQMPIRFLFVGTFCARKGVGYLISTFLNVSKISGRTFELNMIGVDDRNMDDFTVDLLLKVRDFNQNSLSKINLIPQMNPADLDHYYKNSDVYITASISECLPLAILNAMRHGMPVITTDVGGCAEAVEDQASGFVTPPRDFHKLQEAVIQFMNQPEKIQTMGQKAALIFKEKFDNTAVISNFISAFNGKS